jgi:hypothetical protein
MPIQDKRKSSSVGAMLGPLPFLSGLALLLVLVGGSPSAWAEAQLRIDPLTGIAGRFSPLDPGKTEITAGSTRLQVLSPEHDWRLYVTVLAPFRRVSDGLELPTERFSELYPDLPRELSRFLPCKIREGRAAPEWNVVEHDWQRFQRALQDYLLETDPPGVYQSHLQFVLTTEQDSLLADKIDMTLEFELIPCATVEFVEDQIDMTVDYLNSLQGHGESAPIPVLVRSNSPWELALRGTQEQAAGANGQIPLNMVSARVSESASDGTWQTSLPQYQPLSTTPTMVASGAGPIPFAITEALIYVQFAGDVPLAVFSGSYSIELETTVEVAH